MGIVIKKSFWPIVFTYAGVGLGYLNITILFPYFLSEEQNGLLRFILDSGILLGTLFAFGTPNTVNKFFPKFRNKNEGRFFRYIILILGVAILTGVVITSILLWLSPSLLIGNQLQYQNYISYIISFSALAAMINFLEGYLRSYLLVAFTTFFQNIYLKISMLIIVLCFYLYGENVQELVIGMFIVYLIYLICLTVYLNKKKDFRFNSGSRIGSSERQEILRYSGYLFIGAGSSIILAKIDSIMTGAYLGMEYTAIYTTAFFVAVVVELPRRVVSQVVTPLISKAFDSKDLKTINELYVKSATNQLALGGLIYALIICNIEDIFAIIPKEAYVQGKNVTIIIATAKLFDMALGVNTEILINSPHYKWNMALIPFLAILVVASNYFLIPEFGLEGAALATLFSIFIYNIARFILLKIKIKISPFETNQLKVILSIAAVLGFYWTNFMESPVLDLIIKSILVAMIYVPLIYWFNASPEMNKIVNRYLKR